VAHAAPGDHLRRHARRRVRRGQERDALRLSSVICVPLLDRGRLLGIIYVGNDSIVDLFQTRRCGVLTVFAAQASLIVANALLVNELQGRQPQAGRAARAVRFGEIVGTSPPMQRCFARSRRSRRPTSACSSPARPAPARS
jgi:GAF domain-containing protein